MIEDSDMTAELLIKAGISEDLVKSVVLLTNDGKIGYEEYILAIKEDYCATRVKIEDIKHNLYDIRIGNYTSKKKNVIAKYNLALYILENASILTTEIVN